MALRILGRSTQLTMQCSAGDSACRDAHARVHHMGFICRVFSSPNGSVRVWHPTAFRGSTPDFFSTLSPDVFSTRGCFRMTTGVQNLSFHLLGEPPKAIVPPNAIESPKAIEPHLPVCQLCRFQLGPIKWSLPTIKSLDRIVVIDLLLVFQGEILGPATGAFACNYLMSEAWTIGGNNNNSGSNDSDNDNINYCYNYYNNNSNI